MSDPIEPNQTPSSEFQAHFGVPPGMRDAKEECKDWEQLCGELMAERQQLRAKLAERQTLDELIAELEREIRT